MFTVLLEIFPNESRTVNVEVPVARPLLELEKITSFPLFARYPLGMPTVVPMDNVDDPEGLEIVYENCSY
jgi:hypothetical protein